MTHEERLTRLEKVVQVLAEDQQSLTRIVADLARDTQRGFDQVALLMNRQAEETDRRFRETDEKFRQTDEKFRETDERIKSLVSAIGQLIAQRPPAG